MSVELAPRADTSSALSIHADQMTFTDHQKAALDHLGMKGAGRGDIEVFFHQAKRTGLDPFKREIYMIERQGKWTIQTGIDGFYKIADRATRNNGGTWGIPETLWCGHDGAWRDVWLDKQPPAAAKVTVTRDGSTFTTVAVFEEYAARKRDGDLTAMWKKMPARMIAKCAEALAIRRAFPDDLSGLYTAEEMAQADNPGMQVAHAPRPATVQQAPQAPAPQQGNSGQVTGQTAQKVAGLFNGLGVTSKEDKRAELSRFLGREIASAFDMTEAEAQNFLGTYPGPDDSFYDTQTGDQPPVYDGTIEGEGEGA